MVLAVGHADQDRTEEPPTRGHPQRVKELVLAAEVAQEGGPETGLGETRSDHP